MIYIGKYEENEMDFVIKNTDGIKQINAIDFLLEKINL